MATIAIRKEDKNRWERRTPLVPDDVAELVERHGLRVLVEPSERRVFGDDAFRDAGAELTADLSAARTVFGVKEIPPEKLRPETAYVIFAHVVKGQAHNMPLLRRLLELRCTLIDYEMIADDSGRRLVFFGREAGLAGMIDALHLLGRRLAWEGSPTPFEAIEPAHAYRDLPHAMRSIAAVGERLQGGFEIDDGPLVVGFTGRGHVSRGAQEIFDLLPVEEVAAEDLARLDERREARWDRVFKVRLGKEHLVRPRDPESAFDEAEYRQYPERFRGGRLVRFLPHLTVLMHGVYWTDAYPRFLTRREVSSLWKAGQRKLRLIGDVTCDVDGSIELTRRATEPDDPCYLYDPVADTFRDGLEGDGIVVMAVDNLPCELPVEASLQFSRALRSWVPRIAAADLARPFDELDLPPEIRRAVVTHQGRLTPEFAHLSEHLADDDAETLPFEVPRPR